MNVDLDSSEAPPPISHPAEAQFRALFEGAAIGIALVDLNGRPVKCNRALEEILGYSEAELCSMAFPQFTHPDDLEADMELYRRVVSGQLNDYRIEKRFLRKDARPVWTRLTVTLVHPVGSQSAFVVAMVEDISVHKAAEIALRESEEKFCKAFHGNPSPTLITSKSTGRVVEANEAFGKWFGISPEKARGKTVFDFGIWESARDRVVLLEQLQEEGAIKNYEKVIALPSGEVRTALLSVEPIVLHGESCLLTTTNDISQQKLAEEALKQSESRLRRSLAAARMGIWEWDLASDSVIWSDEVYALFGLAPEAFRGTFQAVRQLVQEDDRERLEQEIFEALAAPGRQYYSEMRVRWPDGAVHWIEVRGDVLRDAAGKPSRMLGTIVDVTARKGAESALRSSEESLRVTVQNTPNVAIQWYDERGRIFYWNPASETVFGWEASEVIGKTLDQLIFDEAESARFQQTLKEVEQTGRPAAPGEYRFRRRDGRLGVCLSTVFRMPRAAENCCFVCMDVDVTGQREAERSLREAQERELRFREEFTGQLLNAEEQERQHLAAELHDGLGQNLSIIKNQAFSALAQASVPPVVASHLAAISHAAAETIAEVRQLARNLRPLQLQLLGLTDSIRELVDRVIHSSSVRIECRLENVDDVIAADAATHLYRIVQEALNNLVKHSGARSAVLLLERDIHCVRLRLSDDGVGFDVSNPACATGFGLTNMVERARILGGHLRIESNPGAGTEIIVELPIEEEQAK